MESIINRLDHLEDRTSDNEDKIHTLENKVDFTEKMVINHEQNFKEIWNNMKRANLRLIGIDEDMEIKTKGIHNIFNDIISENLPSPKNEMNNQVQEGF